ncbi:hypothetical protein TruAng_003090 [Truncatella angustata]|nr:hypothetical protein TruAng_003090 [Truncatella angustata]
MGDHDQDYDGSTEQTPLVTDDAEPAAQPRRPAHRTMRSVTSIASSFRVPQVHSGSTIVALFCVILLVASCANGFVSIPLTRVVEDVVCHRYYEVQNLGESIDEKLCKVPAVQSKMAYIFATAEVCEAIAGFVTAFPWGVAADKIGRKPVFALSLVGMALSILWMMAILWFNSVFNPALIATACLFRLIGGGSPVVIGVILSMVSDVIPEDGRATAFLRIQVCSLVGTLVSPALSSAIMPAIGPWPVMLLGVACVIIGAIAFMFVPETLQHKQNDTTGDDDQPQGLAGHYHHAIGQLKDTIGLFKSSSLILLMVAMLTTNPAAQSLQQFLVQFVSKRYGISIASTGYVQTTYGLAQVIQALVILPWISRLMLQDTTPKPFRRPNEQERDLSLARLSYVLALLGYFVLAIAPKLWVFILGLFVLAISSGSAALAHSLLSLYVDPEHSSRLFSMVGMVETIGSVCEPWVGLPYFGIMGLMVIVIVILALVRVPKQRREAPPSYEEARDHQD